MDAEFDIARLEHKTAVVRYRTVRLEAQARKIQLAIAFLGFGSAVTRGGRRVAGRHQDLVAENGESRSRHAGSIRLQISGTFMGRYLNRIESLIRVEAICLQ
jgi:hypothetical protein